MITMDLMGSNILLIGTQMKQVRPLPKKILSTTRESQDFFMNVLTHKPLLLGFHPTAAHLPQPVQPNHPEVAAAVKAQLAHAAAHHYRRYRRDAHYAPPPPPCPPPSYEEPQPSYSG